MTKQEVNQLLALMKTNYSYAFKNMSQQDKYTLVNTWTVTLADLNADVVMIAVMQLIAISKWMPTVAEIREKCKELHYTAAAYCDDSELDGLDRYIHNRCNSRVERYVLQKKYGSYTIDELKRLYDSKKRERLEDSKRQSMAYIASATAHLCTADAAVITLDSILGKPEFAKLGTGSNSMVAGNALPECGKEA